MARPAAAVTLRLVQLRHAGQTSSHPPPPAHPLPLPTHHPFTALDPEEEHVERILWSRPAADGTGDEYLCKFEGAPCAALLTCCFALLLRLPC